MSASRMRLDSYDGAWYSEHNGTMFVTESQILMKWGRLFIHQDNIWRSIYEAMRGQRAKMELCYVVTFDIQQLLKVTLQWMVDVILLFRSSHWLGRVSYPISTLAPIWDAHVKDMVKGWLWLLTLSEAQHRRWLVAQAYPVRIPTIIMTQLWKVDCILLK